MAQPRAKKKISNADSNKKATANAARALEQEKTRPHFRLAIAVVGQHLQAWRPNPEGTPPMAPLHSPGAARLLPHDDWRTGADALRAQLMHASDVLLDLPSLVGRPWQALPMRWGRKRHAEAFAHADGCPDDTQADAHLQGGERPLVEPMAQLLAQMAAAVQLDASANAPEGASMAQMDAPVAIVVPATFGEGQRRAMLQAALLAGLGECVLLPADHAAAACWQQQVPPTPSASPAHTLLEAPQQRDGVVPAEAHESADLHDDAAQMQASDADADAETDADSDVQASAAAQTQEPAEAIAEGAEDLLPTASAASEAPAGPYLAATLQLSVDGLDVCLVSCDADTQRAVARNSSERCGLGALDDALYDWLVEQVPADEQGPQLDALARARLWHVACSLRGKMLADAEGQQALEVHVPYLWADSDGAHGLATELTAEDFAQMSAPILAQARALVAQALQQANIEAEALRHWQMDCTKNLWPQLEAAVAQALAPAPQQQPASTAQQLAAVCAGHCSAGGVAAQSISRDTEAGIEVLWRKGTDTCAAIQLQTGVDEQDILRLALYEGDAMSEEGCHAIGNLVIGPLPATNMGLQVQVQLQRDANGCLAAEAKLADGAIVATTWEARPGVTDRQLTRLLQAAAQRQAQQRAQQHWDHLIAQAQLLLQQSDVQLQAAGCSPEEAEALAAASEGAQSADRGEQLAEADLDDVQNDDSMTAQATEAVASHAAQLRMLLAARREAQSEGGAMHAYPAELAAVESCVRALMLANRQHARSIGTLAATP